MIKMTYFSRLTLMSASLAMLGSYFFPLWRIDLWAPQYPEGLVLNIWHNRLGGNVEIINGLNHYIGMAHLKQENFPEFKILPFLIAGFILLGLLVAYAGQKRFLLVYFGLMIAAGVLALADFYRWGYQYGHNLASDAAIKVPGMSYQPPIIGYKSLLNFGAYSIPDVGGWIFIGAGITVVALAFYESYFLNKEKIHQVNTFLATIGVVICTFSSCSNEIEPISYGKDACSFCKMIITDKRFACEFVTDKGKAMKFDDLHCMYNFVKTNSFNENSFKFWVVNDFEKDNSFLNIKDAYFIKGEGFKSPMNGDVAAFKTKSAEEKNKNSKTKELNWQDIKNEF